MGRNVEESVEKRAPHVRIEPQPCPCEEITVVWAPHPLTQQEERVTDGERKDRGDTGARL